MTPPQLHISFDVLFKAGFPPTSTVGHPGAQGAVVTGIHGMGVSTPRAAAVAAATMGFARDLHIPKGRMFFRGTLSMIHAAGSPAITRFSGVTIKEEGAMPKLHMHIAPLHTIIPIQSTSSQFLLP